jgi:hypothetical protein
MTDEDRHADEVNIAFQMGADWQRDRMKARIEKLEAALQRLIDYGMVSYQDLERARKALEENNDPAT